MIVRLFLSLFALLATALPLDALEVRLRPALTTGEECVRLADVAVFADADESLRTRLAEIVVHRFSGGERECRVSYEAIERAIRTQYEGALVLIGSGLVLTRQACLLTQRAMLDAIQAHFKRGFPHAVFEIDARSLPESKTFMGGGVALDVLFSRDAASGPFTAELAVMSGGKQLDRISFSGDIRIPAKALVAARPLERGRILRAGDVRTEELPDSGQIRIPRAEELVGRRALLDIAEGTLLEAEHFEKPLLVRRGARVTVVWTRGGVHIEAEAIAMDEGREGDIVRLRSPHSGREFSARVGEDAGRVYSDV